MKVLLIAFALLMFVSISLADEHPQTTCPVMGESINPSLHVDVGGYRIYVCCSACIAPIRDNPGKYIQKLKAAGIELPEAPES